MVDRYLVFDLETGSQDSRDGVIASLAAVTMDPKVCAEKILKDELTVESAYNFLVDTAFYNKVDIEHSIKTYGRKWSDQTKAFWDKQSEEARKEVLPSDIDKDMVDVLKNFVAYLDNRNIDRKSLAFVRGQSFDFPFVNFLFWDELGYNTENEPIAFWNQRDTRSYIAGVLGDPRKTKFPIPSEIKKYFVHHNPVHDCAKDMMTLIFCHMYCNIDKYEQVFDRYEMEILG